LEQSLHPLVYTPGDNEWVDCHRTGFDPLERLAFLRSVFFPVDDPLREGLNITRQSAEYPENLRWRQGGVTFLTINVSGDNNNLGNGPAGDAEFHVRNAANLQWLDLGFELASAKGSPAVVVFMHGSPEFNLPPDKRSGFNDLLDALERRALSFRKPVLLVHGDTHYFRIDKPMTSASTSETPKRVENITRVESFGSPDLHWIRVSVDLDDPEIFTFSPEIVEANVGLAGKG
nr:hypothetical protein [Actinomycetota bacterium]